MRRTLFVTTIAALGVAGAGCAPTPAVSPTAEPSAMISVAPSQASQTPESWYPWLPQIDTAVDAALPIDSFARATEIVPVSGAPGAPPFRFDTGDPNPAANPLLGFPRGVVLVVVHGPVMVEQTAWYLLTPAGISVDTPTGWAPIVSPTGSRFLQPMTFDCPGDPIDVAKLSVHMLTDGLPACYGDEEVTITGDLRCVAGPDTIAKGASWLAEGSCRFDAPPTVYGLDPSLGAGRYAVTGRFLDEEARSCVSADGDESVEGRLTAVLFCRRAFVATSATPA